MLFSLYKKEILLYFKTPIGYIFLALILFFAGSIFSLGFLFKASQNFSAYLQVLTSLFAVIAPLLTMKIYSEEFKNRTDQLLLTLPLALHTIVIAKFLAILTIFAVILTNLLLYLLVLAAFGSPDWSHIAIAFIGFILFGASLLSLGMAISSYTQHQLLAAVLSFIAIVAMIVLTSLAPILPTSPMAGVSFLLLVISIFCYQFYRKTKKIKLSVILVTCSSLAILILFSAKPDLFDNLIPTILTQCSPLYRYQSFNFGMLRLSDLIFFAATIFWLQYICYLNLEKNYYKES
jgi:ABC-2 type transport system permease protein